MTPKSDLLAILRVLTQHGVDFIVVGGVGAVLQGAPVSAFDLNVVHSTEQANVARLLAALGDLEAHYRAQPEKRLKPDASHLSSPGHQLLLTRFGPLDLPGRIGRSSSYGDLVQSTVVIEAGSGVKVRVLNLETLIAVKEETAREKDLAMLAVLRRTLEETSRR